MSLGEIIERIIVRPEAFQARELADELRSLSGDSLQAANEVLTLARQADAATWTRATFPDFTNPGQQYVHVATDRTYAVGAFLAKDGIVNRFWRVSDTLTGNIIAESFQPFGIARDCLSALKAKGLAELAPDALGRHGDSIYESTDLVYAKLTKQFSAGNA